LGHVQTRGEVDPYPRHLKPGSLHISEKALTWKATIAFRAQPLPPQPERIQSIAVRSACKGDWNLKKIGKAYGTRLEVNIPIFEVRVCRTQQSTFERAVEDIDVPLVTSAIRKAPHRSL